MKINFTLILLFVAITAHSKNFIINDQHTQIIFKIKYLKMLEVQGSFQKVKGKYIYENEVIKNLRLQISTNSVITNDKKRDAHLKRKDFFYSAKFPYINIEADKINLSEQFKEIPIKTTIKGISKIIPFKIKKIMRLEDPWKKGKNSHFFEVTGKIDRRDFNMTWNKNLDYGGIALGNIVNLHAIIESTPSDQKLAFSRFYTQKNKNIIYKDTKNISSQTKSKEEQLIARNKEIKNNVSKNKNIESESSLIGGFILFLSAIITAYVLKKQTKELLKQKLGPIKSEIISDAILIGYLYLYFVATTQNMGYHYLGSFFS